MRSLLAAELDLENLLLRMPHVLGARVQVSREGSVEKIHVLANRAASPEQLANEVGRTLREQRALRLDPGVVTIVTLDGAPQAASEPPPAQPAERRIELRRLTFHTGDELEMRATAELRLDEIVFTGEASATDVPRARPELAARAILRALEFLRERGAGFYLEGVMFLTGFRAPVALAVVQAVGPREKRTLTGCALVDDSREEAAARATLAAINRFYGSLREAYAP